MREPQYTEGVDLISLMQSANTGETRSFYQAPIDIKQRIRSLDYERALAAELPGDYSWMILPLVVSAGYLLVSEA
jgi:hypothetical protein